MSEDNLRKEFTEYILKVPVGFTAATRLDAYITQSVENATRSKVQKAITDGFVWVNGVHQKSSYKVQALDTIYICVPQAPPPDAEPEDIPLDIVYEDDQLLIINKPAGMVTHPAYGNWTGTLVNALLFHVNKLSDVNQDPFRPGIVHRLDKDTSGLLVIAKNDQAHKTLASYFKDRNIDRHYYALVWGHPDQKGSITTYMGRSLSDRRKMEVVPDESRGKRAVTHFEVIEYFDFLSLIKVKLETGRTHQIRVHMSHLGHPIFCDETYGGRKVVYGPASGERKNLFKNLFADLNRQFLHAKTLGFDHPVTGERIFFESELPEDLMYTLTELRYYCKLEQPPFSKEHEPDEKN